MTFVGFVKLLASTDEMRTLLGVRVVGLHAATIVGLASYLVKQKYTPHFLSPYFSVLSAL